MSGGVRFGSAYGLAEPDSEALRHAAKVAVDEAMMDVCAVADARGGNRDPVGTRYLPQRYAECFDLDFLMRWAVALSTVAFKLAQAERMPFVCLAEKLAVQAIIQRANDRTHAHGFEPMSFDGVWAELGDLEFLAVFDAAELPEELRFDQWFEVPAGAAHPFYCKR